MRNAATTVRPTSSAVPANDAAIVAARSGSSPASIAAVMRSAATRSQEKPVMPTRNEVLKQSA